MSETTATESPNKGGNKVLPKGAEKPPGDIRRRTGAKKRRTGPFIKYVGLAAERSIDAAAWGSLAIDLKDPKATHVWNIANDKMVEADKFSDEQLDYLLVDDLTTGGVHNFLAVDWDNKDDPNNNAVVQVEI